MSRRWMCRVLHAALCVVFATGAAAAQSSTPEDLAKQLTNPVAELVSV